MKRSGIVFVMLRAGYKDDYEDSMFENNYYNAKAAGLDVGAYHYITATDTEFAIYEAEAMLAWLEGKQFEYPIAIDIETENHRYLSSTTFSAIIDAYCSTLEDAGYKCTIYSFASLLNKCSNHILDQYDIWQAHWGVTVPSVFTSNYSMWQFTASGKVPGVRGDVDMNICFYDYPTYIKENHLNGY
jgi:GH25 family lysozyme M1 (1,4-beta-N-acetylmuramidase)